MMAGERTTNVPTSRPPTAARTVICRFHHLPYEFMPLQILCGGIDHDTLVLCRVVPGNAVP